MIYEVFHDDSRKMIASETLEQDGVFVANNIVPKTAISQLYAEFDAVAHDRAGARRFQHSDGVAELISARGALGTIATELAGRPARPVRVLLFDKTPQSNWSVPWHQDRTVAVKQRIDVEGYEHWSEKDGVPHVEPPVAILETMLTLRIFVDDCDESNGPLKIALGSHRRGKVSASEIAGIVRRASIFVGTGVGGDLLIMKTLGIHCSGRAISPRRRRVLHVDYAAVDLPSPLEWALA